MPSPQCPQCFEELIPADCAPCWECGHLEHEIEHLRLRKHKYFEYRVFNHPIILCDFCQVDFSSYKPETFGLPKNTALGLGTKFFDFLREIPNPTLQKDLVCRSCNHRLKFLNWLLSVQA